MDAQRNYYDILGVPRSATLDEIKKRYRVLAREWHPDVNQDKPDASRVFAQINEAYRALSHPDERAVYDAELLLREKKAADNARAGAAAAGMRASRPAHTGSPPRPTSSPAADVARLIAEAQAAFVRGKFVEARALCEQALRRDRRNAQAFEIMGDIFRLQGRVDDAINYYTLALQINPRNPTVMQRVERLSRSGRGKERTSFFDSRPGPPPPRPPRPVPQPGAQPPRGPRPSVQQAYRNAPIPDQRSLGTLLVGVIGYGLAFLLVLYAALFPGTPFQKMPVFLEPISSWSAPLVTVLILTGMVLGFTLAATSAIRRIDDELILPGSHTASGVFVPIGLVMIVIAVFSFYATALLHTIIGLLQESLSVSMGRVFGVVFAVVLLLTAVYSHGRMQVFLFGGNVVFLALLIGWALGDFFRSDMG